MREELKNDSLSGPSQGDPSAMASMWQARELNGKEVYDVNGERLGRITRCFAEERILTRCDVTLTDRARERFHAPGPTAQLPADWIARVDDTGIRLRKAAEELLEPERPSAQNTGARELPRKER